MSSDQTVTHHMTGEVGCHLVLDACRPEQVLHAARLCNRQHTLHSMPQLIHACARGRRVTMGVVAHHKSLLLGAMQRVCVDRNSCHSEAVKRQTCSHGHRTAMPSCRRLHVNWALMTAMWARW